MPIYVESRGVFVNGQSIAEHQYLVYVPIGQEDNYGDWLTIGGFRRITEDRLLNGTYINVPLESSDEDDEWTLADFSGASITLVQLQLGRVPTAADMVEQGHTHEAASARARETAISTGSLASEAAYWASLVAFANDISDKYTYRVYDDLVAFGPTANSNSFISSILLWAAEAGFPVQNYETAPYTPGPETWLGLTSDDVMDANTRFAG